MTMINITALCLAFIITALIIKGICKEFIPNTTYKKHINKFISVVWLMYLGAMAGVYLERENSVVVEYSYELEGFTPESYEEFKRSLYLHGFVHGAEAGVYCTGDVEESIHDCVSRHADKFNGTGEHAEREVR